jgi:hypothetical protein
MVAVVVERPTGLMVIDEKANEANRCVCRRRRRTSRLVDESN